MFVFCFFSSFYPNYKLSEKRKPTIKLKYKIITILYSSKMHVTSSLLFDQFISNIQEIIDIEWLFELICIFLFAYRKRANNSKTGENSKLLLYKNVSISMECVDTSHL